ncbi:MAG: segregation/condensation protein A, partial [Lachnospiraceae bacterium]|nr:segregation/condensation protein A [Lachnospiraceae bacterium]
IDLERKQSYIFDYIEKNRKCSFRQLLEKQKSKMEVIVTFLIVLELIKVGSVDVEQDDTFGEINITYKAPFSGVIDLSETKKEEKEENPLAGILPDADS